MTNGEVTFTATTPDGIIYTFAAAETTTLDPIVSTAAYQSSYRSSWYLSKIESPDRLYSINLNYTSESYRYSMPASCQYTKSHCSNGFSGGATTCGGVVHPMNSSTFVNYSTISGARLSSITTSTATTTINFDPTTNSRSDVEQTTTNTSTMAYPLGAVRITAGSDVFCKKWVLTTGYFLDDSRSTYSEGKRLQLKSIHEVGCSDVTTKTEPYVFTYLGGSTMPHRLSKAIDHWGYYNAKTGNTGKLNVPAQTPCSIYGTTPIGNSNRDATTDSGIGTLKTITYPTKGMEFFSYEPHTYYGSSVNPTTYSPFHTSIAELPASCQDESTRDYATCCPYDFEESANKTVSLPITVAQASGGKLVLTLQPANPSWCSGPTNNHSVFIVVKNAAGTELLNTSLNTTPTQGTKTLTKTFDELGITQAGTYTFQFRNNGRTYSKLQLFSENSTSGTNTLVGGVRIKKITRSTDQTETSDDIIRTFEYLKAGTTAESSGVLNGLPRYSTCGAVTAYDARAPHYGVSGISLFWVRDIGVVPLGDVDGRHITYGRVLEYYGEGSSKSVNGRTEYTFDTEVSAGYLYTKPPQATVDNGALLTKKLFNSAGTEVQNQAVAYKDQAYTTYNANLRVYSSSSLPAACSGTAIIVPYFTTYRPRTKSLLTESVTEKTDNVTTTKTYTYDATLRHRSPVTLSITNSDGKVTVDSFKYAHESTFLPGTTKQAMLTRNMVGIAVEQTTTVAGVTVDGSRSLYNIFDPSTGLVTTAESGFPRLSKLYRYEMTWNNAGSPVTGVWEPKGTINAYHGSSETAATGRGYPSSIPLRTGRRRPILGRTDSSKRENSTRMFGSTCTLPKPGW